MDESVTVSKRLRNRDIQMSSVILDFQKHAVLQCSLNGVTAPRDWDRIRGYYYQYYKDVIDRLEQHEKQNNTH